MMVFEPREARRRTLKPTVGTPGGQAVRLIRWSDAERSGRARAQETLVRLILAADVGDRLLLRLVTPCRTGNEERA